MTRSQILALEAKIALMRAIAAKQTAAAPGMKPIKHPIFGF